MNKTSFFLRFGVWFWALTILYVFFVLGGGAFNVGFFSPDGHFSPSSGGLIGNLIGLFVPVGPNNFIVISVGGLSFLEGHLIPKFGGAAAGMILLFLSLIFTEKLLRKLKLRSYIKIIANLSVLLFLTAAIDFLTFGEWRSFLILIGHAPLNPLSPITLLWHLVG